MRAALEAAVDRSALINNVLKGYGAPTTGPLPEPAASSTGDLGRGRRLLADAGWQWQAGEKIWTKPSKNNPLTLAFSLATSDTPELKTTAEGLKEMWTALGAKVDLKIYEPGDLNQNIIRPRQYDALFFGQILGRTPDLFSFWHSKQRLDPGYNIALYTNLSVDKWLEQLRTAGDAATAASLTKKIVAAIKQDRPAIFIYSPNFLYILPPKVKGASLPVINTPADRFATIHNWYITTDKVWRIFSK